MDKLTQFESNIRDYYNQATEEQLSQGLDWYIRANKFARSLVKRYSVDLDAAIRVIAVLSPLTDWDKNKRAAELIVRAHVAGQVWAETGIMIGKNVTKAFQILSGSPDALKGPKVECFYDNIAHAYTSQKVTVDRHAYRVVIDDPNYPYQKNIPADDLRVAREAYANVAAEFNILPMQLQAVCWIVLKDKRLQ